MLDHRQLLRKYWRQPDEVVRRVADEDQPELRALFRRRARLWAWCRLFGLMTMATGLALHWSSHSGPFAKFTEVFPTIGGLLSIYVNESPYRGWRVTLRIALFYFCTYDFFVTGMMGAVFSFQQPHPLALIMATLGLAPLGAIVATWRAMGVDREIYGLLEEIELDHRESAAYRSGGW